MGGFLNKVEAFTLSFLDNESRKLINQFWRNDHLPIPKFRIVNTPNSKWLARTIYRSSDPGNTTIEIQKNTLNDLNTVKRLLGHELLHHRDFLKNPLDPTKKTPRNPHGESFLKEARRINSRMGRNYVSKVSDQSYLVNPTEKEFEVVLYDNKGRIGYATLAHGGSEQKAILQTLLKTNRVRIIKTKDSRLLNGPALGPDSRFMIVKNKEFQEYLRDLYKQGARAV